MSSAQIVSLFYSSQDQSVKEKALQSLTASQIAALQNKAAAHHVHHAATHVAAAAAGLATLGLTAPPVTPYTPSPVRHICDTCNTYRNTYVMCCMHTVLATGRPYKQ
jgi:hypothetical protein